MKFKIPLPLQQEHEALHERLRLATQAGGEVGEAARTLAQLMHPHFIKEHQGIVAALKTLRDAAAHTGRSDIVDHADPCLL